MPKIKLEKVVSFSSEDPVHTAVNILSPDPAKKWKTASTGEKSASIVIQLEMAVQITGIDIGNEHSAFIEVQVSRSTQNDGFKNFLVMSSFMSPMESRNSQNVNKVRMYNSEQFMKPECEEKWDLVKIICTQPYNRNVKYGISFVTLHSAEVGSGKTEKKSTKLGKFFVREESPDEISAGSIFAKRMEKENKTPLKGAAAIRAASASPAASPKTPITIKKASNALQKDIPKDSPRDKNRGDVLYEDDDDKPNEKIDKIIQKKQQIDAEKRTKMEAEKKAKLEKIESEKKAKEEEKKKKELIKKDSTPKMNKTESKDSTPKKILKKEEKPKDSPKGTKRKTDVQEVKNKRTKIDRLSKPFDQLLNGVVIVISGIQNPDRANLRNTALSMGAKYKPDWENSCTHLICAFANTPKFNQVQGKGKIVTKKWIMDCHKERKRLPWRRYALDKNDKGQDESEEEIFEKIDNDEEDEENDTPERLGSDTEDEIERIQALQNKENCVMDSDASTSEETKEVISPYMNKILKENNHIKEFISYKELPELPNYFSKIKFYIDENLSEDDRKLINQYIVAYDGQVVPDLTTNFDIVISSEETVFDLKEQYNGDVKIVTANWIWECHNQEKLLSFDDFQLS